MKQWKVGDREEIVHRFTEDDVKTFTALTGDDNPVHVDPEYARRTSTGGAVVHGMLAASFVSTLIGTRIPGSGAVWSSFKVDWRRPIRIGDTVRFEATVRAVHKSTRTIELDIAGTETLQGHLFFEATGTVICDEVTAAANVDFSLVGKRIIITGASGSLGSAIARKLVAEQARPILWGRSKERLDAVARELGDACVGVCEVDLGETTAIDKAFRDLGPREALHGFVHVAAPPATPVGVLDEANLAALDAHLRVGPGAFLRICQKIGPHLSRGSSVVAVLTQYVLDAPPDKTSAYVAGKFALLGLVRSMAVELGPQGVRCNAVSPSMANTAFSEHVSLRVRQVEAATNPMRRLCRPEDVADSVTFLLGPDSAFVNGANLPVTGGASVL